MALKGSLKEAGLPDILQLLALGQKTGCLSVTDERNFGHVYFRDGRVIFANLVNREDRLGERLLLEGRVEAAALTAASAEQAQNPERRLGELLVESGALELEELWKAVADQIEDTVYSLLGWSRGYFHFEPGQPPPQSEILVSLDVPALLMEGARRTDEWDRIRERIPHRRLILAHASPSAGAAPDGDGGGLAGSEVDVASVWEAVDGCRDVAAVVAAARVGQLRALSILCDLLAAGRLVVSGESPPEAEEAPTLRRREEYRNLGVAFYEAGMYAEAGREFRQMLALDARDVEARFHLGLVAFRAGRLGEAVEEFSQVVELEPRRSGGYLNLALALEAQGRLGEAERVVEALLAVEPGSAPGRLHRAILHARRGAHAEALTALEGLDVSERLGSVAAFYRALLHAMFWDLRTAREVLAAVPREGQTARILNNLGAVLERGDRLEEARLAYAAALDLGGAEGMARKNLGDLYYREGKYDQARRSYLLALQAEPANAEALHRLGLIAFKEGRRPEALAYWERALECDPTHERARQSLALALPAAAEARAGDGAEHRTVIAGGGSAA
jgi:tetratricopeptide (TPR) repeat protein